MAPPSHESTTTSPSTALETFIASQPEEDCETLNSITSLNDERGLKSTDPEVLTQVCVDFSSHLVQRGFAPVMPQHYQDRAQRSDPLPGLPSWAYDLRLPFHGYLPSRRSLNREDAFEADAQADRTLVAKLYYIGVVGEVNVAKSWFELLSAPPTPQPVKQSEKMADDMLFHDRMISIATSSIHTMETLGGTSLIKTGDLLFSSHAKCFEEGGGSFFLRRPEKGTDRMKLVYSRASGEVRRRGDKRNVGQRVIPDDRRAKVKIC